MKKLILFVLVAFFFSTKLMAWEPIPLTVSGDIYDMPIGNGNGRPSIEVPLVYIEDYTLSFEANHPDYVLIIRDEDGSVVYNTMVYSTQTTVILPSTLIGDFELYLYPDGSNYYFYGFITL